MMLRMLTMQPAKEAFAGGMAVIVIGFLAYEFFATGLYQSSVIQLGSVAAVGGIHSEEKVTAQARLVAAIGRTADWIVPQSCAVLLFAHRSFDRGRAISLERILRVK